MANERKAARSAAEAGWHVSRYNISAKEPETGKTVIVNLLTGSCVEYSPLELYLMSVLDEISEDHPIIGLLARRGAFCGANNTVGATVDHMGNLYQCGEVVGEQRFSYGTAREWDPARPLATASNRDMLTCYLNAFGATCDPECRECVWLPHCAGGCPHMRLFGEGRQCVPYRDNPEAFVLASYAKLSAAQR